MFEIISLSLIILTLTLIFLFKHKKETTVGKTDMKTNELLILRKTESFARLPENLKTLSSIYCATLLSKLTFEGCRGAVPSEEIKVLTTFYAGLLCCGMKTLSPYSSLKAVLIYPRHFYSREEGGIGEDNNGYIVEESVEKIGESWEHGAVILSAHEIAEDLKNPEYGMNIIIHEFAHQLEFACPCPPHDNFDRKLFTQTMQSEYKSLCEMANAGEDDMTIDEYGAESPSEFFAVVSESFFSIPIALQQAHPDLYRAMQSYYNLDPAEWFRNRHPSHEASESPDCPRFEQL